MVQGGMSMKIPKIYYNQGAKYYPKSKEEEE